MKINKEQRAWLTKLINHINRKYWLYPSEITLVENILSRGTYNKVEQNTLQSITKYYTDNSDWKGTLDTPNERLETHMKNE